MMSALEDLRKLRDLLVAARRRSAAQGVETPEDIGQPGANIEILQGRIDAVDKAIADEAKIAGLPGG
jgi:hypothetical protein